MTKVNLLCDLLEDREKKVVENIAVYVEIIIDQQVDIKRALDIIFKKSISNSKYKIQFKLILQINYKYNIY